jgi:hypothetical protein
MFYLIHLFNLGEIDRQAPTDSPHLSTSLYRACIMHGVVATVPAANAAAVCDEQL